MKAKSFRRQVMWGLFWKILAVNGIFALLWFLGDSVLDGWIANQIAGFIGHEKMYLFYQLKTIAGWLAYVAIVTGVAVREVWRYAGYTQIISDGIHLVPEPAQNIPSFPEEIRDTEFQLRALQQDLALRAQRAKEAEQRKNDLIVYLAHDLKTPLTSVIGYLTLLEESPELPVEQRAKFVHITMEKAYRLETLINEFFEITRFNLQTVTLVRGQFDAALLLRQLSDEFYPVLADHHLTLKLELAEKLPYLGDADKLSRVFDNLLRNAVSYSTPGSEILLTAKQQDHELLVAVQNHGAEIPKEQQEHLFEKFFRADSARGSQNGGAGLGLAIAKQLVQLHGGTIVLDSDPYRTIFTVRLPQEG